jgi:hypothetical protein
MNTGPAIPLAYATNVVPLAPPDPSNVDRGQSSFYIATSYSDEPLSTSARSFLTRQGFTGGLIHALENNRKNFASSMWIVDNSGSMSTGDGHKISACLDGCLKFSSCTRWNELQQTVEFHAQMAATLRAPTSFRLLNDPGRFYGPQQFGIALRGTHNIDEDLAIAQSTMINSQPGGATPLVPHIREIRNEILNLEPMLKAEGTKVAIVLATDGLPTDNEGRTDDYVRQEFIQAMRSLEGLSVWVVVRLCTDEDDVVAFWNDLDSQVELKLDVLDDFQGEAQEVHSLNKWLNYALPLHRMREMGFHHRVFDLLDERKLHLSEVRDFLRILFGSKFDEAPDPDTDWKVFVELIETCLKGEQKQWNPITKRKEPWIDVKKLAKEYGHGGWFGW